MTAPARDAATRLDRCRACDGPRPEQVLDLGERPAADLFPPAGDPGPDPAWPLGLMLCPACGLVQLTHRSPAPQEPRAVESRTVREHAAALAARLVERLGMEPGTPVHERSSAHGGSWLPALTDLGMVPTDGPAPVVLDNHAIIHDEDIAGSFADLAGAVAPGGALVIEFHHALAQLTGAQVDTVRHGHPAYFSLRSWEALCTRHGLRVVDAWPEPVYGGCLVVVARCDTGAEVSPRVAEVRAAEEQARLHDPQPWREMGEQARANAAALRAHLEQARASGRRVLGYGAGSKAPMLLSLAGVDADLLPATADLAPAKHGRRLPGTRIEVLSPEQLVAAAPDEVLVLLWDIAPEVAAQLRSAGLTRARYVVAGPRVHELDG